MDALRIAEGELLQIMKTKATITVELGPGLRSARDSTSTAGTAGGGATHYYPQGSD